MLRTTCNPYPAVPDAGEPEDEDRGKENAEERVKKVAIIVEDITQASGGGGNWSGVCAQWRKTPFADGPVENRA